MINKSRHGVHCEGLPILNYKLSQVGFFSNYMNENKCLPGSEEKHSLKKISYGMPLKWSWVISVIWGKLAKTCRNTMLLVSACEEMVQCHPLYFLYFPLYIVMASFGEPSAKKKKSQRKVGIFKTILFPPRLPAALICKLNHATHHCEFGAL